MTLVPQRSALSTPVAGAGLRVAGLDDVAGSVGSSHQGDAGVEEAGELDDELHVVPRSRSAYVPKHFKLEVGCVVLICISCWWHRLSNGVTACYSQEMGQQ